MRLRLDILGLLAVVTVTASACAASITPKDKLGDVVFPFYDDWRWKDVAGLTKRIDPEHRQEFVKLYAETTADIEFADYEVTEIEVQEGGLTAEVTVTFHWYKESDMTLMEAQVIETWKRASKAKPWYRTGQVVVTGSMP